MTDIALNYLSILVATVLSFAFGAVWYMSLSKQWLAAIGKTEEQIAPGGKTNPAPFIMTFILQLLMAWLLAGLIGHMGGFSLKNGLTTAFWCWLAFVFTTMTVNHRYSQAPWNLTVIDGAHWLGVMLIQGAVLGWWNAAV
jgi:hypothetical protein